jgi:hypothetical protein
MNLMKRIAESQKVQTTFVKTAIAAATVAAMTLSVAAPLQADTLDDLNRDVQLALSQLDRAQTPSGISAVEPASTTAAAARLTGVFGTIGILGAFEPDFVPPVAAGDNRLSTTTMWRQAETAYQTLMLRCEYWRDNADGPSSGLVGNSVVAGRINALETGTRQNLAGLVEVTGLKGQSAVMDKLDQIDNFLAVLNAPLSPIDTTRLSSTKMNGVISEFYDRVLTLCPAVDVEPQCVAWE